jgi:hypothetical protein
MTAENQSPTRRSNRLKKERTTVEMSLVPELWRSIASFLLPRYLTNLCLTSSTFLRMTRDLLYREINLSHRHTETLSLLLSDTSLARSVLIFRFNTLNIHHSKTRIEKDKLMESVRDATMAMSRLRVLDLHIDRTLQTFP